MKLLFENWREFINEQKTALGNEGARAYGDLVPFKAKPNAYKLYRGADPPGFVFPFMMQGAAHDGKDIYFRSEEEQEEWLAKGQVFAPEEDDPKFKLDRKKVLYNTKDFIKWYELALQELNMEGGFSDVEVGQLSSLPFKGVISCPNGDCYKKMLALGHVKYDYMNKPISAAKKLKLRGSARRTPAEFIVLHISQAFHPRGTQATLAGKKASTNYEVTQNGIIYEYVESEQYTHHAGWINEYAIGVDFTGRAQMKGKMKGAYQMHDKDPPEAFAAEPLSQGGKLVSHLCKKYNIPQVVAPYNFRYLFNKALIEISRERKEVDVIRQMWYGPTKKEFMALQELNIRDLLKQFGYGIIPHKVVNPNHGCPGPNFEYSSFGDVSGHNIAGVQQKLSEILESSHNNDLAVFISSMKKDIRVAQRVKANKAARRLAGVTKE